VAKMLLPLLLLLTRFKRLCVLVCRYTHRLLKVSVMRLDREAVCVVCCVLCVVCLDMQLDREWLRLCVLIWR
jgi:hypothetical protein